MIMAPGDGDPGRAGLAANAKRRRLGASDTGTVDVTLTAGHRPLEEVGRRSL